MQPPIETFWNLYTLNPKPLGRKPKTPGALLEPESISPK